MPTLSHGNREWQALSCVAESGLTPCRRPVVPDSPGPLCGHHLMRAYEFAQGIVNANWREDWREILGVTLPEPEPPAPSWVYFLRRGDRIKIGFTTDPATRFTVLRADEVLHVEPGDTGHERALHAMFAQHWITGEWFRPAPALLDYIASRAA